MDNSTLFLGAGLTAIIATISSMWGYVKAVVWKFVSLFINSIEVADVDQYMLSYMLTKHKKYGIYDKLYKSFAEVVNKKYKQIGVEVFGNNILVFWNGWSPIIYKPVSKKKSGSDGDKSGGTPPGGDESNDQTATVSYTFLRGTFDFEKAYKEAYKLAEHRTDKVASINENNSTRFFIYRLPENVSEKNKLKKLDAFPWYFKETHRLVTEKIDDVGHKREVEKPTELLVFPPDVKKLIEEIKCWALSEPWYKEKHIPWKRGWLLYGPPGTGKSALSRAIAEELDIPMFVFNLAEMDNKQLYDAWGQARNNTPCIVLMEDIDNVFHGREYVAKKAMFGPMMPSRKSKYDEDDDMRGMNGSGGFGLSFDVLLNCMDGVDRNEGIFTIITTNDITKIDPALGIPRDGTFISSRPGRLDKAIELTYMRKEEKILLAQRILSDYPVLLKNMIDFVESNNDPETPAQFQERCAQIALNEYWTNRIAMEANAIIKGKIDGDMAYELEDYEEFGKTDIVWNLKSESENKEYHQDRFLMDLNNNKNPQPNFGKPTIAKNVSVW